MNLAERCKSVLVIDDEDSICLAFKSFFGDRGWQVSTASSAADGLSVHAQLQPAVVFLDVRLPDRSGLSLLDELAGSTSEIIVITAYGGFDTAVQAIGGKAFDYLVKPLDLDVAIALADRIWESRSLARSPEAPDRRLSPGMLIGSSPCMQKVYKLIARAAESASPVLIDGETGTGKELVARAIHKLSSRNTEALVALNCAAIPENLIESDLFGHVRGAFTGADRDRTGRFELADGGCLLLDEVGDLPPSVQVKLLRVLDDGVIARVGSSETKRLNVRVLAVTNKNLEDEVRHSRFRRDLYYRLHVLRISLPPLRERKEDIPALAAHFLRTADMFGSATTLDPVAIRSLMAHDWPGNVRELKNAVEHAAAIAPRRTILAADLPPSVQGPLGTGGAEEEKLSKAVVEYAVGIPNAQVGRCHRTLEQVERALIAFALRRFRGNQSDAAEYLGLHRNTLRNKLRDLRIEVSDEVK